MDTVYVPKLLHTTKRQLFLGHVDNHVFLHIILPWKAAFSRLYRFLKDFFLYLLFLGFKASHLLQSQNLQYPIEKKFKKTFYYCFSVKKCLQKFLT